MTGVLKQHRFALACALAAAVWVSIPNLLMRQQRRFYQERFPEAVSGWTNNGSFSTIDAFSTLADDNYYYAARIKQAAQGAQADPYIKGNDSPALRTTDWLTWQAFALIWRAWGNYRQAWMVSQFLFTLLWVPLLYAFCLSLGADRGPALFLAVLSTLYADLARIIVWFLDFHPKALLQSVLQYSFWFLGSYHYFLGPSRITGPLFTYPCLFAAALLFVKADKEKKWPWVAAGGLAGGLLAYVHADVFFAFMGAGGLYWLVRRSKETFFMLAAAAVLSVPWLVHCRPTHEQVALLGLVPGRRFFPGSLVFLAGAALAWKKFEREGLGLWCAGLLLSMFLACNTPLVTGWILAQGHWFFLGNTFLLLVVGVWLSGKLARVDETDWRWLTVLTFLICLPRLVSYAGLHYKIYALPAAEEQAYRWLNDNTPEGSVVAALSTQTDFRIAAHTHDRTVASFLFPVVSDIPLMENAKRINYALSLYGVSLDDYLREGSSDWRRWEDELWLGAPDQAGRERAGLFRIHFCALGLEPAKALLRDAAKFPVEDFKADYAWDGPFERSLRGEPERSHALNPTAAPLAQATGVHLRGFTRLGWAPEWPPKKWAKVFENEAVTVYKIAR